MSARTGLKYKLSVKIECPRCGGTTEAYRINQLDTYRVGHGECGVRSEILAFETVTELAEEPLDRETTTP